MSSKVMPQNEELDLPGVFLPDNESDGADLPGVPAPDVVHPIVPVPPPPPIGKPQRPVESPRPAASPMPDSSADGSPQNQDSPDKIEKRGSWLDGAINSVANEGEEEEEEETPATPLQEMVRGTRFTLATTALICVNGLLIGIETDHNPNDAVGWQVVEVVFLILYCLELAIRLVAEGFCKSLKTDNWVRFDATVLSVAILDMIVITPVMESQGGGGGEAKSLAMVLRMLRLAKLARIVRLLRFFKELWLLVASMGSAMKTLGWTFMLLTIFIYVFAILFVKLIGQETEDEDLQVWFGNLGNAMFTLFQIVTLESWGEIARAIWATEDRQFMLFVVLFFIGVSSFAILNTVMAVIVEHTLGEAMDQKSDLIKKAEEELKKMTDSLLEIFVAADEDGGGTLSKKEFITALDHNDTRKLLQKMDLGDDIGSLDSEEIGMLFDTIDIDHNKELSPQEFVNGMMQMRGPARARRIFELQCSVIKIQKQNKKELKDIENMVKRLNGHTPVEQPQSGRESPASRCPSKTDPKTNAPSAGSAQHQAVAELETKIESGLARQKKAVFDLEAKFDRGMSQVAAQLDAVKALLPVRAA